MFTFPGIAAEHDGRAARRFLVALAAVPALFPDRRNATMADFVRPPGMRADEYAAWRGSFRCA